MKLDLGKIRQPNTRYARTFEPSEVEMPDDAYRVVAPVHLEFDIHKDKDQFRLVGTARTELELPCSRCLEPFRFPLDLAFDQRYLPQPDASPDEEREVVEEDLETSFYRDEQIDLNELLREQFYLALPMKPLCREDCRGLCVQCGTNLNTATCDCSPAWEDPRLGTLKQLKTRDS
jgi:uncharacterized protein